MNEAERELQAWMDALPQDKAQLEGLYEEEKARWLKAMENPRVTPERNEAKAKMEILEHEIRRNS